MAYKRVRQARVKTRRQQSNTGKKIQKEQARFQNPKLWRKVKTGRLQVNREQNTEAPKQEHEAQGNITGVQGAQEGNWYIVMVGEKEVQVEKVR